MFEILGFFSAHLAPRYSTFHRNTLHQKWLQLTLKFSRKVKNVQLLTHNAPRRTRLIAVYHLSDSGDLKLIFVLFNRHLIM